MLDELLCDLLDSCYAVSAELCDLCFEVGALLVELDAFVEGR